MQELELKSGFHISTEDSRVTPTQEGIFIPYDGFVGDRMRALLNFITQYCDEPEKNFPRAFAHRYTLEEISESNRPRREQ